MTEAQMAVAAACLAGAEDDSMAFPDIVGALIGAGFESYAIDFRRATAIYFLVDGESLELVTHRVGTPVSADFDAARLLAAIREAQQQVAGYSYRSFCKKAAAAGCAGYVVSFPGRRAVYSGRSGETHVEHFPD